MKPASLLAVLVFSIVALSHLVRLLFRIEVVIGGAVLPMWVSVVGAFFAGILAVALWREGRPSAESPPAT